MGTTASKKHLQIDIFTISSANIGTVYATIPSAREAVLRQRRGRSESRGQSIMSWYLPSLKPRQVPSGSPAPFTTFQPQSRSNQA